jgi:hypothetical protein
MDKTKLGVVAAIATTLAVPAVAPAQTFADLLAPIPDAAARLQQADMRGPAPQLVQTAYDHHHHHHAVVSHHHHHYVRHYRRVVRRMFHVNRHDHHHHHAVVTHHHHNNNY